MRTVFHAGLMATPTRPWEGIIPQICARLGLLACLPACWEGGREGGREGGGGGGRLDG